MTSLSPSEWHQRFTQQSRWTEPLRKYLYSRTGLDQARCVLDVGCGTGAIDLELEQLKSMDLYGIDIDPVRLVLARNNAPRSTFIQADAFALPFSDHAFDGVLCHYFLLWVSDPVQALIEMRRVTCPNGLILVMAEPDYGGRIDYPTELSTLGVWQQASLRRQGADPRTGRRLPALIHQAGIRLEEYGVVGGQWKGSPSKEEHEMEWKILLDDLKGTYTEDELQRLQASEMAAWERGERVLFVPTFYAWGRRD